MSALGGASTSWASEGLQWLSTGQHFEPLLTGLVDTGDLAYFAVMIAAFLILSKTALESARWR